MSFSCEELLSSILLILSVHGSGGSASIVWASTLPEEMTAGGWLKEPGSLRDSVEHS